MIVRPPARSGLRARIFLSALLALVALGLLQGCGRKGAPERPEGSDYPRDYPYRPTNDGKEPADGQDERRPMIR
jgi:predicted small lipoprotein YifL